jgi:hypothetical protein
MAFAFGVARAFAAPASRSLPADTVAPERLPWLVARFSGAWQAALIVGPVLGGFLYTVDIRLPYLASAALLVIAAGAISMVRRPAGKGEAANSGSAVVEVHLSGGVGSASEQPPRERGGIIAERTENRASLGEALEGLSFIRRHPVLLGAISLDLFAVLFGGAVALLPAIATDRLGVDAVGLGWLRAAGGLGAGLVTLGLAIHPVRRNVGRVLLVAVATFGVTTIALGVTRSFLVAFVALAILSGADSFSVFIRATLVPLVTPEEKRGRVMSVENVFIGASNELGAFESGVAGQILGPAGAVVLGGVGTLLVAAGWWFLFPDLRRVDGFPEGPSVGP